MTGYPAFLLNPIFSCHIRYPAGYKTSGACTLTLTFPDCCHSVELLVFRQYYYVTDVFLSVVVVCMVLWGVLQQLLHE